jgi:lipoprotein NlpI
MSLDEIAACEIRREKTVDGDGDASILREKRGNVALSDRIDREPFPDVYRLFAGEIEPGEILERIDAADVTDAEKEKRLFYAHLYIGLNELVEGRRKSAREHLRKAVLSEWPRTAGFGPHYMWQVGRLQYELISAEGKRQ